MYPLNHHGASCYSETFHHHETIYLIAFKGHNNRSDINNREQKMSKKKQHYEIKYSTCEGTFLINCVGMMTFKTDKIFPQRTIIYYLPSSLCCWGAWCFRVESDKDIAYKWININTDLFYTHIIVHYTWVGWLKYRQINIHSYTYRQFSLLKVC